MEERDELGAFLLGFIVGGFTGVATALLLAPKSGTETRTIIREKAIELRDKANVTFEEAYAQAEAAAAEAKTRAEEFAAIAKERADELQKRGQVILEEQKSKIEEAAQSLYKEASSGGQSSPTEG